MSIRLQDDRESLSELESSISYDRLHATNLFTRVINAVRIHNVPLINFCIIGLFGTFLARLTTKYTSLYMKSSLVTIIVTNLVLYGISETLAQSILSYAHLRPLLSFDLREPHHGGIGFESGAFGHPESPPIGAEFADSDDEGVARFMDYLQEEDHPDSLTTSDQLTINWGRFGANGRRVSLGFEPTTPYVPLAYYNFNRLAGFMCWGLIMSFAQCWWYKFLSIYSKDPKFIEVLRKVLTDQLCFSPVSLFCFFTYGTMVLENGTWRDTKQKLAKIYFKTLMINYSVWVPIQFFNFLLVDRNFQVPFSSSVSVLWNCFLSMRNSQ
jgi:protein Mpv17